MKYCPDCQHGLRRFRDNLYCYNCGGIFKDEDNRSRQVPEQTRSIVQDLLGKMDVTKDVD